MRIVHLHSGSYFRCMETFPALVAQAHFPVEYSVEEVQAAIAGRGPDAEGGSARVYRTFLRGQPVAVKVVALAGLVDGRRALLTHEVQLLASMPRHPNIVQLRGCVAIIPI